MRLLAPLLDDLVFVGGCTTGLFITDPAAGGIRSTNDIDAIAVQPRGALRCTSDVGCNCWLACALPLGDG